jgi:hypothetical protein
MMSIDGPVEPQRNDIFVVSTYRRINNLLVLFLKSARKRTQRRGTSAKKTVSKQPQTNREIVCIRPNLLICFSPTRIFELVARNK